MSACPHGVFVAGEYRSCELEAGHPKAHHTTYTQRVGLSFLDDAQEAAMYRRMLEREREARPRRRWFGAKRGSTTDG